MGKASSQSNGALHLAQMDSAIAAAACVRQGWEWRGLKVPCQRACDLDNPLRVESCGQ